MNIMLFICIAIGGLTLIVMIALLIAVFKFLYAATDYYNIAYAAQKNRVRMDINSMYGRIQ